MAAETIEEGANTGREKKKEGLTGFAREGGKKEASVTTCEVYDGQTDRQGEVRTVYSTSDRLAVCLYLSAQSGISSKTKGRPTYEGMGKHKCAERKKSVELKIGTVYFFYTSVSLNLLGSTPMLAGSELIKSHLSPIFQRVRPCRQESVSGQSLE